jgi:hypothetical protein
MTPLKDSVVELIKNLPEDCTLEDIQYHLYVYEKIVAGRKAAEEGRVVSHEEVCRRAGVWEPLPGQNPQ